jgi:hypothetical protein
MQLGKLDAGESKAIFEQQTVDGYALQLEATAARLAESRQIKTNGSRAERNGNILGFVAIRTSSQIELRC